MDQNAMNPMAGGNAPAGNQNNFGSAMGMAPNAMPAQPQPMMQQAAQAPVMPPMNGGLVSPAQNPAAAPVPNIGLVNMNPVQPKKEKKEKVHFPLFSVIGLTFACGAAAIAIVLAVQNSLNYKTLDSNADFAVEQAVLAAKDEQRDLDEKTFAEEEKLPLSRFEVQPSLGSISFNYPKSWNVYVSDKGTSGSSYLAYFRPDYVDSVDDSSVRYSLIFQITNKRYEEQKKVFDAMVTKGSLTSQMFEKEPNIEGIRYDGTLTQNMVGSTVLIKIGDTNKTAIFQTQAQIYKADFDKIIDSVKRASD